MNLSGTELGKYRLVEKLGRGGMASVYRAFQPNVERDVAVKVLHSHLAESAEFITRFQREARGLGRLQHPHIVGVIDFDQVDDTYYMVMEYIRGGTLSQLLNRRGRVVVADALRIGIQLAGALAYAHRQGMVHRDIKPGNVMFLDEKGEHALLTDFGIARIMDDATLTASGAMVGTPAYMSPEAVRGEPVDARSDIYSLGVLLYEMVTGTTPYDADTAYSIIYRQANEPLTPPSRHNPTLPPAYEAVVVKALAKEATDRYQSAEALLADLRAAQLALSGATLPPAAPPTVAPPPGEPAPPPRRSRRRRLLGVALGGLLLFLCLFLLLAAIRNGRTEASARATAAAATTAAAAAVGPSPAAATPVPTDGAAGADPLPSTSPAATLDPAAVDPAGVSVYTAGQVHFLDHPAQPGGRVLVEIFRMPLPAAGTHYELWLTGPDAPRRLGEVPVTGGRVYQEFRLDEDVISRYDGILLTVEADGEAPSAPGDDVVLVDGLPPDRLAAARGVVGDNSAWRGLRGQAALAVDHLKLARSALDGGDLPTTKLHIEHVVNILQGESGADFGDVDGDGRVENPGDGVGLVGHLADAAPHLRAYRAGDVPLSPDQLRALETVGQAAGLLPERVEAVSTQALRLQAADSAAEAEATMTALLEAFTLLADGSVEQPGLRLGYASAVALAAIPVDAGQLNVPPVGVFDNPSSGAVGTFLLTSDGKEPLNSFALIIPQAPPAGDGLQYGVWLYSRLGNRYRYGGPADVVGPGLRAFHSYAGDDFGLFNTVIVSRDPAGTNRLSAPADPLFQGQFDLQQLVATGALLTDLAPPQFGGLVNAFQEYDLARQAAEQLLTAQEAGDLSAVRRHAEQLVLLIEGSDGPHAGDLDGDGVVENPGDGIGIQGHIAALQERLAATEPPAGDARLFYRQQLSEALFLAYGLSEETVDEALLLLAAENSADAEVAALAAVTRLGELSLGVDRDDNGVVDPLRGEGTLLAAVESALALARVPLFPIDS